ncbi:Ldh family oxidoreductase [Pulveribacter sp.]|uniref:Ldh family oxidoreductase n=2 Tax=Pulveribacter sp. TaxID=2678893 RepID=UPI00289B0D69|nr:Ldh family oxidoreductase [Pulveribacter sp.]
MDAGNGFAQPAWQAAHPALMAKARANGIALLAVRNSRHFAALWPDVEPLARDGLVALALVNSMACVVPSGGTRALFGTNPTAFAAPRAGHDPPGVRSGDQRHRPWQRQIAARHAIVERCKTLVRAMGGAGQTRQPGERRYRQRERSLQKGVGLPGGTWAEPQRLAGSAV